MGRNGGELLAAASEPSRKNAKVLEQCSILEQNPHMFLFHIRPIILSLASYVCKGESIVYLYAKLVLEVRYRKIVGFLILKIFVNVNGFLFNRGISYNKGHLFCFTPVRYTF